MRNFIDILNGATPATVEATETENMTFREIGRLFESEGSDEARMKAMKDGEEIKVSGYSVKKLPDTADFSFAVSKDGYEEKFYSVAKAMEYITKQ